MSQNVRGAIVENPRLNMIFFQYENQAQIEIKGAVLALPRQNVKPWIVFMVMIEEQLYSN